MFKYSIILPVRNGGEYVKECIYSILAQTLPDFNLHVLDNCSTDGTTEWLQSLTDARIIFEPASKPLTIEESWARITAIKKNEFITLIGHDDILEKNYLQVMDDLIRRNPDASLYQTHFRYINANGKVIRKCKPMAQSLNPTSFMALFLCNMIDSMGTGFMMRSADYDAVGGIPFYPNLLFADFELWINLTKKSYIAIAFEECFFFRLHQSTTTTSSDIKFQKAFGRFVAFLKQQKNDRQLHDVIERYSIDFISFYTKGLAHRLLRTPKAKREGQTVASFIATCKQYATELAPGNDFNPYENYSIALARKIDDNAVTRSLFLAFKKLYSKPIYS